MVDCFLKSAQINVNLFNNRPEELILPAFYHTYEFKVNKKLGVLKPHPVVCKLFKEYLASQGEISMETTSVPMLVPPRPWRATKDGAYLILPGLRTLSELCFREHSQPSQSFPLNMTIVRFSVHRRDLEDELILSFNSSLYQGKETSASRERTLFIH